MYIVVTGSRRVHRANVEKAERAGIRTSIAVDHLEQ